ncbi:MAG: cysteine--tRNA ligase [Chloroflexi bacterium]|nr:cysteine--tRNA ligase [Chloroflexota bacterium]
MKLYNTLTGRLEEFVPQRPPEVRMYVCGVTPYDECHLGHAMSYITFDALRRYLEYRGYRVRYVQNFTDVDDKIINRAQKLGVSPSELAERHIASYFADMDALHVLRAHTYPRVTEEIAPIVEIVGGLLDKGHAYRVGGSVYFRVASWPAYGRLSHRRLEDISPSEGEEGKEHPADFALWKESKPGEPAWDSPWGLGRPGWHIECSAMSLKYLGNLDIHGGGQDLVFPHHENEIAQSEAYTGQPFARYWLHNGMLQMGAEKMSKSLGNLITVQQALARYSPDAIRLMVLSSHYRKPLTYGEETLAGMERAAERLRLSVSPTSSQANETLDTESYRQRFLESLEDDFSTPQAIAALFDLARDINRAREQGQNVGQAVAVLRELCGVLGLTLEEPRPRLEPGLFLELASSLAGEAGEPAPALDNAAESAIEFLIALRGRLRRDRRYAQADSIRARLGELGIALEDTASGTAWRYRSPSAREE